MPMEKYRNSMCCNIFKSYNWSGKQIQTFTKTSDIIEGSGGKQTLFTFWITIYSAFGSEKFFHVRLGKMMEVCLNVALLVMTCRSVQLNLNYFLKGICCAFNFEAAENIFVESQYTKIVQEIRNEDGHGSFENSSLPGFLC